MATGQVFLGSEQVASPVVYGGQATFQQGLTAGGAAPTVAVGAGAGAGTQATITGLTGYDWAGNFTVNTGTASTAAGTIATVTFGTQLPGAPASVVVSVCDVATPAVIASGAGSITKSGFSVFTAAPTANKSYTVTYVVVRSV